MHLQLTTCSFETNVQHTIARRSIYSCNRQASSSDSYLAILHNIYTHCDGNDGPDDDDGGV
eukprot:4477017-Karenia_brevis.AAC.1